MSAGRRFGQGRTFSAAEIAAIIGGQVADPARGYAPVESMAPLAEAGPTDLAFIEGRRHAFVAASDAA